MGKPRMSHVSAADRTPGGTPGDGGTPGVRKTPENASDNPDIELALPARAENIAVVRHAFGALGEALGVREETLSDIRLAVTEACTNVVLHAYDERSEGPLAVGALIGDGRLVVTGRDRGGGITPRPDPPGLGVGLPLIASLAESLELKSVNDRETEVRMTFRL